MIQPDGDPHLDSVTTRWKTSATGVMHRSRPMSPIRLPYRLRKGESIRQSVTLRFAGEPRLAPSPADASATIGLGRETGHRVPRIGVVLEGGAADPELTADLIGGLAPNVVQFLWDHAQAPALPALQPSAARAPTSLVVDALLPDDESLNPSLALLAEQVATSGMAVRRSASPPSPGAYRSAPSMALRCCVVGGYALATRNLFQDRHRRGNAASSPSSIAPDRRRGLRISSVMPSAPRCMTPATKL